MPYAQDNDISVDLNPVEQNVRIYRDEFACIWMQSGPPTLGEGLQAVTGKKKFAAYARGSKRFLVRYMSDNPTQIGDGAGAPDNPHDSAWNRQRCVEIALGDPQKPCTNLFMRHRSRIGIRFGNRFRDRTCFCVVIVERRNGIRHGSTIQQWQPKRQVYPHVSGRAP